jgi:hypothetical protein
MIFTANRVKIYKLFAGTADEGTWKFSPRVNSRKL